MKRVYAAAVTAAAAFSAPAIADMSLAGDISVDPTMPTSSITRAEVRAGIDRAAADNEWRRQSANPFESTGYSRAAARADYLKSRSETSLMTGEDSGSSYLKQGTAGARTRSMGAGPR